MARRQNRVSLFGAFLDSILDRYADLLLFLGLLVYYALVNSFLYAVLAGAAIAGTVMVATPRRVRNRSAHGRNRVLGTTERLALMILGALTNRMEVALWILAIGPDITVVHRILHTWKRPKTQREVTPAEPARHDRPGSDPSDDIPQERNRGPRLFSCSRSQSQLSAMRGLALASSCYGLFTWMS